MIHARAESHKSNAIRNFQSLVSLAQSLDDEQVAALAAYYASLPKAGKGAKAGKKVP